MAAVSGSQDSRSSSSSASAEVARGPDLPTEPQGSGSADANFGQWYNLPPELKVRTWGWLDPATQRSLGATDWAHRQMHLSQPPEPDAMEGAGDYWTAFDTREPERIAQTAAAVRHPRARAQLLMALRPSQRAAVLRQTVVPGLPGGAAADADAPQAVRLIELVMAQTPRAGQVMLSAPHALDACPEDALAAICETLVTQRHELLADIDAMLTLVEETPVPSMRALRKPLRRLAFDVVLAGAFLFAILFFALPWWGVAIYVALIIDQALSVRKHMRSARAALADYRRNVDGMNANWPANLPARAPLVAQLEDVEDNANRREILDAMRTELTGKRVGLSAHEADPRSSQTLTALAEALRSTPAWMRPARPEDAAADGDAASVGEAAAAADGACGGTAQGPDEDGIYWVDVTTPTVEMPDGPTGLSLPALPAIGAAAAEGGSDDDGSDTSSLADDSRV